MRLITFDDIIETLGKARTRGWNFIASKLTPHSRARTLSAFDDAGYLGANWWIIPRINQRWNHMITGHADLRYEDYVARKYFSKRPFSLLSIGSGVCSHELYIARHYNARVTCVDIAGDLLKKAEGIAKEQGLSSIIFKHEDIRNFNYGGKCWDAVLFHQSLHHFKDISGVLGLAKNALSEDGLLIIHEYVGPNRMQFPSHQIQAINGLLQFIPRAFRVRKGTMRMKNKISGPGILRMIIADPSECVASEDILPEIYLHFTMLEEKPLGGNLLMLALKDIAHHFVNPDDIGHAALDKIFALEDKYLERHPSDFIFGVYRKKW